MIAVTLLCGLLAGPTGASAEPLAQGKGRTQGQVTDAEGRPLGAVEVTAHNPEATPSTVTVTSDDRGHWSIQGMIAGHWVFTFEKPGFARREVEGDVSMLARNPDLDVTLELDAAAEPTSSAEIPSGVEKRDVFDEGNRLLEAGDYAAALARWQEFLAANPDLFQINLNVGNAYRLMGDPQRAKEAFQVVLDHDPGQPAALFNMGEIYLEEGDGEAALPYLERFVASSPTQPEIYFNVAELYFAKRLIDKAIEHYERALELNPEFLPAHRQLGYAYVNAGDIEKAITAFERFLELAPEDDPDVPIVRDIVSALKGGLWTQPAVAGRAPRIGRAATRIRDNAPPPLRPQRATRMRAGLVVAPEASTSRRP